MVQRDRWGASDVLMNDYFVENPKYNDEVFKNRFRLSKELFLKIAGDIEAKFEWFQVGYDARGKMSFTAIQKCTSAIRQLATSNVPDEYDEYFNMYSRISSESLHYFFNAIIDLYGKEYLRRPTRHDITRLFAAHEAKWHFPGMISKIDCTHIVWRSCPKQLRGTAPTCPFTVNGRQYRRGFYLVDGIYPAWSVFVKAYLFSTIEKEILFKKLQESARKDVEWAFGVLKGKCRIIDRPVRLVDQTKISSVVYACVILHNMIIKEEGRAISPDYVMDTDIPANISNDVLLELRDEQVHYQLRFDLTEHVGGLDIEYEDPYPSLT